MVKALPHHVRNVVGSVTGNVVSSFGGNVLSNSFASHTLTCFILLPALPATLSTTLPTTLRASCGSAFSGTLTTKSDSERARAQGVSQLLLAVLLWFKCFE